MRVNINYIVCIIFGTFIRLPNFQFWQAPSELADPNTEARRILEAAANAM